MTQIVKEVKHMLVLSPDDVRAIFPIISTGIKNSPARGHDVKIATPIVEKMSEFLREFGSEKYENE